MPGAYTSARGGLAVPKFCLRCLAELESCTSGRYSHEDWEKLRVGSCGSGAAAASAAAAELGAAASAGVAVEVACAAASGEQDVVAVAATSGSGIECYLYPAVYRGTSACRGVADNLGGDARIFSGYQ